jgi:hypothetical protein
MARIEGIEHPRTLFSRLVMSAGARLHRLSPKEVLLLLSLASILSILHTFATSRAAPVMLSIKDTPDEEAILAAKLDRFARWHAFRATFQVLAFFVLLWALGIS